MTHWSSKIISLFWFLGNKHSNLIQIDLKFRRISKKSVPSNRRPISCSEIIRSQSICKSGRLHWSARNWQMQRRAAAFIYMQWSSLNQQILQYSYQLAFGEFIESTQKGDRPAQQVAAHPFPKTRGGEQLHICAALNAFDCIRRGRIIRLWLNEAQIKRARRLIRGKNKPPHTPHITINARHVPAKQHRKTIAAHIWWTRRLFICLLMLFAAARETLEMTQKKTPDNAQRGWLCRGENCYWEYNALSLLRAYFSPWMMHALCTLNSMCVCWTKKSRIPNSVV